MWLDRKMDTRTHAYVRLLGVCTRDTERVVGEIWIWGMAGGCNLTGSGLRSTYTGNGLTALRARYSPVLR